MAATRWLTIVVSLGWLGVLPAETAEVLRTTLIVRVYDTVALAPPIEERALAVAGESLGKALVDVRWTHCTPGPKPAEPSCARPLGRERSERGAAGPPGDQARRDKAGRESSSKEVSVRIVRTETPASPSAALGDAYVDTRHGDAVLATVYYNRVLWLAAMAGTDPSTLLGRALAHELGHLLMASNRHAPSGLMRPTWTRDEVRRDHAPDWVFDAADVAVIRRRAARF